MTSALKAPGTVVKQGEAAPPLWVEDLFAGAPGESLPASVEGSRLLSKAVDGFSLTSLSFPGVEGMDILTFQQAVADSYRVVLERIRDEHALRFWAFIPRIHADYGNGLDRYMAFNAGRFAAFSAWLGGRDAFSRSIPTGSAVGLRSNDFSLHCLASRWPGLPVENPRQVPSYRYSRRFGPMPPCFARATLVRRPSPEAAWLLVGGTASISGEESVHPGDLAQQTSETFRNLASVVRSALQPASATGTDPDTETSEWLGYFRHLRVYFREPEHQAKVLEIVAASAPGVERVEILPAELCRPELLVEIEGVAVLPATG